MKKAQDIICDSIGGESISEEPITPVLKETEQVEEAATVEDLSEVLNDMVSNDEIDQALAQAILEEVLIEIEGGEEAVEGVEKPREEEKAPKEESPKEEKEASVGVVAEGIHKLMKAGKLNKSQIKDLLN